MNEPEPGKMLGTYAVEQWHAIQRIAAVTGRPESEIRAEARRVTAERGHRLDPLIILQAMADAAERSGSTEFDPDLLTPLETDLF